MKEIKTLTVKAIDLKTGFGNPRKISKKKKDQLRESIEKFGDFGLFLIDEKMNVIAGNQRLSVIMEMNPDQELLCKQLIGYTNAELRAINIEDNLHAGEWDLDLLADWTADLSLDLGIDLDGADPRDRDIKEMELIHYEKYDYVMIVCRNEIDYNTLVRSLGIEGAKVKIGGNAKGRKINGRAVWFDKMKAKIVPLDDEEANVL